MSYKPNKESYKAGKTGISAGAITENMFFDIELKKRKKEEEKR